jgi:hypothetical protein
MTETLPARARSACIRKLPKYRGTGSIDDAANFDCADPAR